MPSVSQLRSTLTDPAVNLLFEGLKKELKSTKARLEETQNELSAWKFTPDRCASPSLQQRSLATVLFTSSRQLKNEPVCRLVTLQTFLELELILDLIALIRYRKIVIDALFFKHCKLSI